MNEAETVKQVKESFHQMVGLLSEAIPVIESKIVDNLSQIRTEKNAIISAWIEILKQNKQTLVRDKQITDILTQWQNNTLFPRSAVPSSTIHCTLVLPPARSSRQAAQSLWISLAA